MPKLLDGKELADYITERQARQVRALRQARNIFPRLVIIASDQTTQAIDMYMRMKERYGTEILVRVDILRLNETDMPAEIAKLNADDSVHGIIVQLPLSDASKTDDIVNRIAPEKDIDGLGEAAIYDSATATAINWLMAGYGIDIAKKKVVIVGNGRLVGAPLYNMWKQIGYDVTVLDDTVTDLDGALKNAEVIISATGSPRIINSAMVPINAVVVDAGTASENGVLVGDVAEDVRERDDIKITPVKGGVGPLTVAALFDAVIQSAQRAADGIKA